jgi:hypothetical protein
VSRDPLAALADYLDPAPGTAAARELADLIGVPWEDAAAIVAEVRAARALLEEVGYLLDEAEPAGAHEAKVPDQYWLNLDGARRAYYRAQGGHIGMPLPVGVRLSRQRTRAQRRPAGPDPAAEREHHPGCGAEGLYAKYEVRRTDGSDQPGGRHHGCWYFVLDPAHDPDARTVLRQYAGLVAGERPRLAADLLDRPELRSDPRYLASRRDDDAAEGAGT